MFSWRTATCPTSTLTERQSARGIGEGSGAKHNNHFSGLSTLASWCTMGTGCRQWYLHTMRWAEAVERGFSSVVTTGVMLGPGDVPWAKTSQDQSHWMICLIGAIRSVMALSLVSREKWCLRTVFQVFLKQVSKMDQVSGTKNLSIWLYWPEDQYCHLSCRHPSFFICSGDITWLSHRDVSALISKLLHSHNK